MAFITREASRQLTTVSFEWLHNRRLRPAVAASLYQAETSSLNVVLIGKRGTVAN